jgi:hypothetical protein
MSTNPVDTIACTIASSLTPTQLSPFLPRVIVCTLPALGFHRTFTDAVAAEVVKLTYPRPVVSLKIDAALREVDIGSLELAPTDATVRPCHEHSRRVQKAEWISIAHSVGLHCRLAGLSLLVQVQHVDLISEVARTSNASAQGPEDNPAGALCAALCALRCSACRTASPRSDGDCLISAIPLNVVFLFTASHAPSVPRQLRLPPDAIKLICDPVPYTHKQATAVSLIHNTGSAAGQGCDTDVHEYLLRALPAHRSRWLPRSLVAPSRASPGGSEHIVVDLSINLMDSFAESAPTSTLSHPSKEVELKYSGSDAGTWPAWFAGQAAVKSRVFQALVSPVLCLRLPKAGPFSAASGAGLGGSAALAVAMRVMGITPQRGLLLHGPAGSGKTLCAKAIAFAAGLRFMHIQCPLLVSKYVGDSEASVRAVFREARHRAPCLILLDDIDAIAQRRAGSLMPSRSRAAPSIDAAAVEATKSGPGGNVFSGRADRLPPPPASVTVLDRMLATLLNEMDGVGQRHSDESSTGKLNDPLSSFVLVVGTTNRPLVVLDEAIMRAGRLELHVEVPLPDAPSRLAIIQHKTARLRLAEDVSLESLCTMSQGCSAAELAYLCDAAALGALQDAMESDGPGGISPILADMLGSAQSGELLRDSAASSSALSGCLGVDAHAESSSVAVPSVRMRHFLVALLELRSTEE